MAPAAPFQPQSHHHQHSNNEAHREAHLRFSSGETVKGEQPMKHSSSSSKHVHINGHTSSNAMLRKLRRNVLTEIKRTRDSSESRTTSPRMISNGQRKQSRTSIASFSTTTPAADTTDDEDSEAAVAKRVRRNGTRPSITSSISSNASSSKKEKKSAVRTKERKERDAAMAADSNLEEENSEELDITDFSEDGDRSYAATSDEESDLPKSVRDKKKYYYVNNNGRPSELFRTDLIQRVRNGEESSDDSDDERAGPALIRLNDRWREEWNYGVQVVMSRADLPKFIVDKSDISPVKRTPFVMPSKYLGIAPSSTIDSDNSRYVSTLTHKLTKQPFRRLYEGDKLDEIYLKKLNEIRSNVGRTPVSFQEFLNIMDALEVDTYKNIHQRLLEPLNSPASRDDDIINDEDAVCDVCRGEDSEDGDDLLFCDGCNLCVHLSCYGLEELPPESWYCMKCTYAYGINPPCALCPTTGGAMKSAGDRWVHVACALWLPECRFGDVERREKICDLDKIPDEKWQSKCVICDLRQGACIKCTAPNCKTWFHVTCALRSGYEMRIEQFADESKDGVDMISRCLRHRTENRKAANTSKENDQNTSASDDESESKTSESLRRLESEFYLYANYEDIAKRLHYDLLLVSDVYEYWKQKREHFGNTPLIKNVHDDIIIESSQTPMLHLPSSPIFTPNVPTNTPLPLQRLRACLDKERNIATLIVRRERAKAELFRTQKAICENIWRQTTGSHPLSHRAIAQLVQMAKSFMTEDAIAEAQKMSPFEKKKPRTPSPSKSAKIKTEENSLNETPKKRPDGTPKKRLSEIDKNRKSTSFTSTTPSKKSSNSDSLKKSRSSHDSSNKEKKSSTISKKSPEKMEKSDRSPDKKTKSPKKNGERDRRREEAKRILKLSRTIIEKPKVTTPKKEKRNGERQKEDDSPISKRLRRTM